MYRILVCGSRTWSDYEYIYTHLKHAKDFRGANELVHGDARGADRLAGKSGKDLGYTVIPVPADWDKYGKKAGPIRNQRMLDEFGPFDEVWAFKDKPVSVGTDDMIWRARDAGYEVTVFTPNGGHTHLLPFRRD